MLKTTSKARGWIILAAVLWLVILAAIIFIPLSRGSEAYNEVKPTNSLTKSLLQTRPGGDAVAAQLVDPAKVYDPEAYLGYTTLCPGEPAELVDAKKQAFELADEDVNLDGELGYVLLIPAQGDAATIDPVDLDKVDICTVPQSETFPLNTAMPFHVDQGRWVLGMGQ
ncbi:hypothetical protein [Corynebacterium lujinxingii]|uniref:Uncharacterized protein n=1 Tax=Corynebacterium lujinxingii TaxID=2763010 RepID=A0A7H0JZW2_9CORY|nr:hypothetical protein [Corynebacterium lujinxingii]MBC3179006.1 hypothetical protein [Corynebacterium lujinxingii]NNO11384.1 hypothetical protein [Corynebacterium lujinxingii]QNP90578.1 hypothetical protein IAU68_01940 [Corynebacterium lujinxingii]